MATINEVSQKIRLLEYLTQHAHKCVTYLELENYTGVETRQELYGLVFELRKEYMIETVYAEGYIYWDKLSDIKEHEFVTVERVKWDADYPWEDDDELPS